MLVVTGLIDGIVYTAIVRAEPAASGGETEPEQATTTPAGPEDVIDPDDAESVYVALCRLTQVTRVDGDVPDIIPPRVLNSVE